MTSMTSMSAGVGTHGQSGHQGHGELVGELHDFFFSFFFTLDQKDNQCLF